MIKSRLGRGRGHLRGRMIRRGIAPAALAYADFAAARSGRGASRAASIEATLRLAVQLAERRAAAGLVPTTALILVEGAPSVMGLSRLKLAIATPLVDCGAFSVRVPAPGRTGLPTPRVPVSCRIPGDPKTGGQPPAAQKIGLQGMGRLCRSAQFDDNGHMGRMAQD